MRFSLVLIGWLTIFFVLGEVRALAQTAPSLQEAKSSKLDLWGEWAISQPNGPSYELFEPLLPPPRYVHADFRLYPLVLSAPASVAKARFVSNGSGINSVGGTRSWKEVGTPIAFRVGPDEFRFGGLIDRVSHPKPREGWLPIYEVTYRHPFPVQSEGLVPIDQKPIQRVQEVYRMEVFATCDERFAEHAVVFVRFSLAAGSQGIVKVTLDPATDQKPIDREWRDASGKAVAIFDSQWKFERRGMVATLNDKTSLTLAIATQPIPAGSLSIERGTFDQHLKKTTEVWSSLIDRAMQVIVPEERVQNAWRNLLVQNWMLMQKNKLFYSADNQYEQLYVAEGGDAVRAMMDWGYEDTAKQIAVPIFDYLRKGLENHQAGLKLQDMAHLYWKTRDIEWLRSHRNRYTREIDRLMGKRDDEHFLLPKERYCGDISTPVHSLSVEGKGWRALHDWRPILLALDEKDLWTKVCEYEQEYRRRLKDAVEKSIHHETDPPFLPLALLDREEPHSPITSTRIGSYWSLLSNFVIGSRIFPPGSAEENWLPEYLERHGGLCMGMTRAGGTSHGFWTGSERTNPLYGTRYVIDALRRNEPDRALVSFYGMLAQGFTRDTFVAGEGCTLDPVDPHGRFFYCPPNSAGNAHFLSMLRHLLLQEGDEDDDGEPETLRILHGTSRRWLQDGKEIVVERAPTSFGPMSLRMRSELNRGLVTLQVAIPDRPRPKKVLAFVRLPDGWKMTQARAGQQTLPLSKEGGIDLSQQAGLLSVDIDCIPQAIPHP